MLQKNIQNEDYIDRKSSIHGDHTHVDKDNIHFFFYIDFDGKIKVWLYNHPTCRVDHLPSFNEENSKITTDQHAQKLKDVLDLYEIEEDDVHIIMFTLSLQGNAKSWFKNLPAASIFSFHQFSRVFLDRWAVPVNVFLILE